MYLVVVVVVVVVVVEVVVVVVVVVVCLFAATCSYKIIHIHQIPKIFSIVDYKPETIV